MRFARASRSRGSARHRNARSAGSSVARGVIDRRASFD
jgi:hypothetical protein